MNSSQTTQTVSDTDFNRFMSARFAPREKQQGLLLFCALDAELEKISHQTSDPLLRRIRTQFWREALYEQEGGGHWLAREMIEVFGANEAVFGDLEELIVAHENSQDMDALPATKWAGYCERQTILFKLALTYILDGKDPAPTKFYQQCGQAYGGAQILCVHRDISLQNTPQTEKIQYQAKAAYAAVLADLTAVLPSARAAVLPLALVLPYLDLFQASDKADSQSIDLHPARKAWILWRAIRKGFK